MSKALSRDDGAMCLFIYASQECLNSAATDKKPPRFATASLKFFQTTQYSTSAFSQVHISLHTAKQIG